MHAMSLSELKAHVDRCTGTFPDSNAMLGAMACPVCENYYKGVGMVENQKYPAKKNAFILAKPYVDENGVNRFAGEIVIARSKPNMGMWLHCNGARLPSNLYSELYISVGDTYCPKTAQVVKNYSLPIRLIRKLLGLTTHEIHIVKNPSYLNGFFTLPDLRGDEFELDSSQSLPIDVSKLIARSNEEVPNFNGAQLRTTVYKTPLQRKWQVTLSFNNPSQASWYHKWLMSHVIKDTKENKIGE
jgi:hypothetical protein